MLSEIADILVEVADILKPYNLKREDADKILKHFKRIAEIVRNLEDRLYGKGN